MLKMSESLPPLSSFFFAAWLAMNPAVPPPFEEE
jgi:hypothetical protein